MPAPATLKKWAFCDQDPYLPMVFKVDEMLYACVGILRRAGGVLLAVPGRDATGADPVGWPEELVEVGSVIVQCGAPEESPSLWEAATVCIMDMPIALSTSLFRISALTEYVPFAASPNSTGRWPDGSSLLAQGTALVRQALVERGDGVLSDYVSAAEDVAAEAGTAAADPAGSALVPDGAADGADVGDGGL